MDVKNCFPLLSKMRPAVFNQNLPKQPVPSLNQTLEKYFKSVKPFLDESELKTTEKILQKFQSGIGPHLQKQLETKAEQTENWIAEWWVDFAYLERRYPIAIHKAPGLILPIQNFQNGKQRLEFAAKFIWSILHIKSLIDNGKLPVDKMGQDSLDMSQYTICFGTCRIPGSPKDTLDFNPDSRHIVVVKNNNFFKLPVINDDGESLSVSGLVDSLQNIVEQTEEKGPAIGILTTENRDNWAEAYQHLIKDSTNLKSVREIQKAMFLVCLDSFMPKYVGDIKTTALHQVIHGGGADANSANRWFDKTLQFVVGEDGIVGTIFEHSPIEATLLANINNFIVEHIENEAFSSKEGSTYVKGIPERLFFNMNKELQGAVKIANENMDKLVANFDVEFFKFASFGKEFVKSQNLSPDSFIQMAIQYAYYRIYKIPGSQYEAGGLKRFRYGRTETIRSCSVESIAFAKAMLDSTKSNAEKVSALKLAVNTHNRYAFEAVRGLGIDRHLLALKLIALENGLEEPELFKDPGFTRTNYMPLGTSQVATKFDGVMSFGPRVPDGYICCYNPRSNDINFGISAYKPPGTTAAKFATALEASLEDMRNILVNKC